MTHRRRRLQARRGIRGIRGMRVSVRPRSRVRCFESCHDLIRDPLGRCFIDVDHVVGQSPVCRIALAQNRPHLLKVSADLRQARAVGCGRRVVDDATVQDFRLGGEIDRRRIGRGADGVLRPRLHGKPPAGRDDLIGPPEQHFDLGTLGVTERRFAVFRENGPDGHPAEAFHDGLIGVEARIPQAPGEQSPDGRLARAAVTDQKNVRRDAQPMVSFPRNRASSAIWPRW